MRAPPRPSPRKHLRLDEIALLLRTANEQVNAALGRMPVDGRTGCQSLFVAEQNRLREAS
jgi:hypothetical protein